MKLTQPKQALLSYFDSWTLAKGRDYFNRQKVLGYKKQLYEVRGFVSGSSNRKYQTILFLDHFEASLVGTECSCPMAEDCKHAAALYLDYLQELPDEYAYLAIESDTQLMAAASSGANKLSIFEAPQAVTSEPALAPLPFEVVRSFSAFASAVHGDDETPYQDHSAGKHKDLVYIIHLNNWKDGPNIEIRKMTRTKNGAIGKGTKITFDRIIYDTSRLSPADKDIIGLWQGITMAGGYGYYSRDYSLGSAEPKMIAILMTMILQTQRCFFEFPSANPLSLGPELDAELIWNQHQPGQFRLELAARDGERAYKCMRNSLFPWYVDTINWRCGPIRSPLDQKALKPLLGMRDLTTDEAERLPALLADLEIFGVVPEPPVATKTQIKLVKPTRRLEIRTQRAWCPIKLSPTDEILVGDEVRTVMVSKSMPESSLAPYKDEAGNIIIEKPDEWTDAIIWTTFRDLGFGEIAPRAFGPSDSDKRFFLAPNPAAWSRLDADKVAQLRAEGWQISSETEELCKPLELEDELNLELSGEDNWWFSLALDIEVNGKTISLLPILVSAIRSLHSSESIGDSIDTLNRGGKFIGALPDGSLVSIPFERIRAILVSIKELIERGLDPNSKLPTVEAADLLDDETLSRSRFIGADKIIKLVRALQNLKEVEPVEEPSNFKTVLRPYQKDGLGWLQFLAKHEFGGILADDMGLGKTIQLLAHICLEKQNKRLKAPYLVLCPTSVLPNWLSEASKFAPHLKVISFHGADRVLRLNKIKDADLVVTTYPILSRDIDVFKSQKWHGVALDEAQAIKNHKTKMAQAARSLDAKHKFCLTGTPVENHLGELWSQFQFLLPGLLGDSQTFKSVFRDPIEKLGDSQQRKVLARRVKPFILRRAKKEVAQELPDKTVVVQSIELEGAQRDLYETVRLASVKQVRDEIAKKGFKHSQIMILDALLKMRQVCCDPRLVKLSAAAKVSSSAKLEALIEMLEQLTEEGRKILVFSQFTSMLEIIEARLNASDLSYVKLTGDTRDRVTPVKEFQEGNTPIFLISLKAGGTGLNLTQADVVIHYDPWWNPAVEEQATDRAHRIGQTKKVFVYKLIAKGTIEQRIMDMQERKRAIASSVYDEEGNFNLKFSEQDLEALLSPIDADV